MKISIDINTVTTEEVELDFPLYILSNDVLDSGSGWETIYRVESTGHFFLLTRRYSLGSGGSSEFEFERGEMDIQRELGAFLSGRSAVEANRYLNMLAEFQSELRKFPGEV